MFKANFMKTLILQKRKAKFKLMVALLKAQFFLENRLFGLMNFILKVIKTKAAKIPIIIIMNNFSL